MNTGLKELIRFVVEAIEEDIDSSPSERAMRKQFVNLALSLSYGLEGECVPHIIDTQRKMFIVLASVYANRPGGREVLINAER